MIQSIEDFFEKEKYFEVIYRNYENKLDYFYNQAENQVVKKEYARGGECIHRGFYCPSPVLDIIVGNCKRGKLVKKPRKQPDYEYWFDSHNRLILSKQRYIENSIPPIIELIFYNSNCINSVLYQKNEFNSQYKFNISLLTKCVFENELIKSYDCAELNAHLINNKEINNLSNIFYSNIETELKKHLLTNKLISPYLQQKGYHYSKNYENNCYKRLCYNIQSENFEYNDQVLISSTLANYNFDLQIMTQEQYFYNYDSNGNITSYTSETWGNGKQIPCIWDGHVFKV